MEDNYTPIVNLLISMKKKGVINAESIDKCIDEIRDALAKEKQIIEDARLESAVAIFRGEHWDENWYYNKFQNPVII